MNDQVPPEIVEVLNRLIRNNEMLGHQIAALTFVCAHLLKEQCMASVIHWRRWLEWKES